MTHRERIFRTAEKVFGRPDVFKAWPQIDERVEHALWSVWNEKYGPLNPAQLEYSTELICYALRFCEGKTRDHKYASFHYKMQRLLNHEDVDVGFKRRADQAIAIELPAELMKAVPA